MAEFIKTIAMLYNTTMHDKQNDPEPVARTMQAMEFSDMSSMEVFDKVADGEEIATLDRVEAIRDLLAFSSRDWDEQKGLWDIWEAAFGKDDLENPGSDSLKLTEDDANELLVAIQDALNNLPDDLAADMEINQMKQLAFSGKSKA